MGNVIVSSDPIPMISISVEEYKALLQAQTELNVIYHKSVNGDVYDTGTFVQEMRNAIHPILNIKQEDTDPLHHQYRLADKPIPAHRENSILHRGSNLLGAVY